MRNTQDGKFQDPSHRPMSAKPKYLSLGKNRAASSKHPVQTTEYEETTEQNKENMSSNEGISEEEYLDEYEALNIQEISEVPNFEMHDDEVRQGPGFSHKIFGSRPTTASIFKKDKDYELPYPELFDRTERTFAACYAKFGDLSYYTAVQRIGNYMDFSSRLKRKHLMDIIQYMKNNKSDKTRVDEDEEDEHFNDNCLFLGAMIEEELGNA